ncbi:hypothetical protein SAMN05443287_10447 [Micromonospora phaseoli]|uniref:Uncharacterized protein n=1 Tax=Micromonospora phaseoli TaxID=1144548 RepID=A0A1H6Y400_9ACTN|nr:hypothetical protein [Micromonospora phaseoli]PZW00020.1 hypothetical protein CLV64_10346 [Micromonospora phaseoli]GIJ80440.1 hypothetical protein Xph01_48720 [Micromonospora phaseoli]SEJ36028.1 hypothetical protein SAMN05443287_10447 [Micromonospora phaseoli]
MTTNLPRRAHWHRPLLVFVSAMAVLAVVSAVGIVADQRVLTGVPIWLKPFKFSVSFVLYGLTLAWLLTLLRRRSRIAEWAATVVVAMGTVEMAIIVGQVLRGTASHYNETSPLNATLWLLMGAAIMVLFAAHLVIGIVVLRQPIADRAARYAVSLGIGLALLGMLVAIPMTLPGQAPAVEGIAGAHSVGVSDGGPGLPLVGWSTTGGDLRIGHFVGLHALQVLPILALLLSRFSGGRLDERTRARLLVVAGAAYGAFTLLLTWQALRGQPLLRPDALTLAATAALVAATATATLTVLRRHRRLATAPNTATAPGMATAPNTTMVPGTVDHSEVTG